MIPSIDDLARIPDPRDRAEAAGRLMAQLRSALAELAQLRRQAVAGLAGEGTPTAPPPGAAADGPVPAVVVERSVPTDPAVRAGPSLFLGEASRQGVGASRRMLEVGEVPAPAAVAGRLGVESGEPVVVRSKLLLARGVPVRLASSYCLVALARRASLLDPGFVEGGLQERFEALGLRFGHAVESFTVRLPTAHEAELLLLEHDVPVVDLLRSSYDVDGRPVHTLETICAGDRHVFTVRQVDGDRAF